MNLYFILTDKCNYQCKFCIRNNINVQKEFVFDNFCIAANRLHECYPDGTLILTGGEPFLHVDYRRIIKFATKLYKQVVITTNGSLGNDIVDFLIPFLKKNLFIQISLDGTKEIHDCLRGAGAYTKVLDSLERLRAVSNHVAISTTVGKSYIKQTKELAIQLNQFQFHHWKVSPEQLSNPTVNNIITSKEWNSFVIDLLPLCRYRVHIKKLFAFDLWERHLLSSSKEDASFNNNCGWGKTKLYVLPNGDVLPCTCLKEIIANVFVESPEQIKQRMENISCLIMDEHSICYSCKFLNLCNGGCPGYSQKYFGKKNMGDIRCPKIFDSVKYK